MAIDYQYYEFQSYEYLVRLGQLWEGMEELTGVQELLAQIRKEQELIRTRKFRVAVVGEFRRGKSTFVNALLCLFAKFFNGSCQKNNHTVAGICCLVHQCDVVGRFAGLNITDT